MAFSTAKQDSTASFYDNIQGFSGARCEVNQCTADSCRNGGDCVNEADRFRCDCRSGWTGGICDQDVNECDANSGLGPCTAVNDHVDCETKHEKQLQFL